MKCLICDSKFDAGKRLSEHIKRDHGLSGEAYTVKFHYDGVRPSCPSCGGETRYTAFKFKRYCADCKGIAAVEGGKRGGKSPAWNKGATKETDQRVTRIALRVTGEGNPFYGRRHTLASIERIRAGKRITPDELTSRIASRSDGSLEVLYEDYTSRQRQHLTFRCAECGETSEKTLQAFERGSLCPRCYPNSTSRAEIEIGDFVRDCGYPVSRNNRQFISPKEIDVLVADRGFALEYEGLFWHSEENGKSPKSHLHKTRECEKRGVPLFRVYADQWRAKRSIVESMIRHRLGAVRTRVHARKCSVVEVASRIAAEFMNESHLYGHTVHRYALGLSYEGKIVCVVTLRVPRQSTHRAQSLVEIARFASARDTIVTGGFQRLLPRAIEWAKRCGFKGMISYADLDTGHGNVYLLAGFDAIGETGPSYWYTNGVDRFDRFKYRARAGKTEREIAKEGRVYRIYGAGSRIYRMMFSREDHQ
jgi:Zn finger protein HypA/HybF involved in hydrogenase expression